MLEKNFFKGKRILITGHTGFKGTWLCKVLVMLEAEVFGYSLDLPTEPSLFELTGMEKYIHSVRGDIRNIKHLSEFFCMVQPEIVIHMAAQPLVRESYMNPVYTYSVNVMGTVNVLECIRNTKTVKSFLNVTTDKVYLNKEWEWGYRENEELNGMDPYSNSKSCSELVTSSYLNSFFQTGAVKISTARAGNVIGGGDFADDRIIPDCVRAIQRGENIIVRNPYSVRPYQHVLEPLIAYLEIVERQYCNKEYAGSYNVGPDDDNCLQTGELVNLFCEKWNAVSNDKITWVNKSDGGPHEAQYLKLDCSKIKKMIQWKPHWSIEYTVEKIIEWTKVYLDHGDINKCMEIQIKEMLRDVENS